MNDDTSLVTVASFREPWEAHIARGRLEAEDVPAFVTHEHHVTLDWPLSQALGGVKLQVPAHRREEALRILDEIRDGSFDGLLEGYEPIFDSRPCQRCGSDEFRPVFSPSNWVSLLFIWLGLGIIFPAQRRWNRCRRCGFIWNRYLS
jgi:hypothetical protein